MLISLVLPTNRTSYGALARIVEWSSLPPDKFELIVRDNSENAEKRDFLSRIRSETLRLDFSAACSPFENALKALESAQGDYVLPLADDDSVSIKGLYTLHSLAENCKFDSNISCVTGDYFVESSSASGIFRYNTLEQDNPDDRIDQYITHNAANFLYYSAVKKEIIKIAYDFLRNIPYRLSYHDQLISLIYLRAGKIVQAHRVVYGYDMSEWETTDKRLDKDRSMYVSAGLPPETSRLHHLLCGVEGSLLLDSHMLHEAGFVESPAASDQWLGTMISKLRHDKRGLEMIDSRLNVAISGLLDKIQRLDSFDVNELLADICDCLEEHSPQEAQSYFEFWSAL